MLVFKCKHCDCVICGETIKEIARERCIQAVGRDMLGAGHFHDFKFSTIETLKNYKKKAKKNEIESHQSDNV